MLLFTSKKDKDDKLEETVDGIDLLTPIDEKKESTNISLTDVHFGEELPEQTTNPNTKEPEDFFFDMGMVSLLNNTTIYFNCFVEKHTVDEALRLIRRVNQNIASIELDYPELKGQLPFKFIINSGGGNVVQGLRLFDAIKNNVYPVITIANGIAASMGIILLVAGKESQATEHSVIMIHQLSAGAQGKYFELQGHMKFQTDLQDRLAGILIENSSAKKEDVLKFMKGETYMLAPEALKLGLISKIVNI